MILNLFTQGHTHGYFVDLELDSRYSNTTALRLITTLHRGSRGICRVEEDEERELGSNAGGNTRVLGAEEL